jgi:hypothetical protein
MEQTNWETWQISDLRVIKSEDFIDDEDGEVCYCVYSFSIDAVSLVGENIIKSLRERGIQELDNLPAN